MPDKKSYWALLITQGNPTHVALQLVRIGAANDAAAPAGVAADTETPFEAELRTNDGLAHYVAFFHHSQVMRPSFDLRPRPAPTAQIPNSLPLGNSLHA